MSFPLLQDEPHLINLVSQDSEYAFTKLYDHYRPLIYSVAVRLLRSRELAEEVLQDVFIKVWLNRGELTAIKQFRQYIFFIARISIFDRLKKQAYESRPLPIVETSSFITNIHNRLHQQDYQSLMDKAIDQLTDQQAFIYRLAKVDGLSYDEIALRLHMKKSTVKRQIVAALRSIRLYFKEHPELCVGAAFLVSFLLHHA